MSTTLSTTPELSSDATSAPAACDQVELAPLTQAAASQSVSEEAEAQNAQSEVLGSLNGPERDGMRLNQDEIRGWLQHIAAKIEAHREDVTRDWRERVSGDVLLANSPEWSKRQFEDHIPDVILVLCAKARAWPEIAPLHSDEKATAEAHSKHRWQQGYDMRSLAREWGHFNGCLLGVLDRWIEADEQMLRQALRVMRSLVSELILESTSESVSEYSRLLQAEASARARQMSVAIEHLREEERWRGQVLREAAHDLRGSLGLVTGTASLIDRSQMDAGDRAEVGRILRSGVRSLSEMMTDLIDLARLEAGEEKTSSHLFDASEMLRSLGTTSLPMAQSKSLELSLEGPNELKVWGDALKVRRIAQNLLLNAIKYTRAGGVHMAWGPDGDERWLLRVSDTGPGLNRSEGAPLAQALKEATDTSREVEGRTEGEQNPIGGTSVQPSAQTGSSLPTGGSEGVEVPEGAAQSAADLASGVPGEGVGLSIVKRLCDLLGASIELDSRAGEGSTFRVLFPRSPLARPDNPAAHVGTAL